MDEHLRARRLLGPYVLEELGPEEQLEVERHLGDCAACREEERGLRETHERLSRAANAGSSAPPSLEARVLSGLRRDEGGDARPGGGGTFRSPRLTVVAAAVMVIIALSVLAYSGRLSGPAEPVALEPTGLAPEAGGEIEVQSEGPSSVEASLEVWGLPPTGPDEYYQLWLGREGGRVSVGTFEVDSQGRAEMSASVPELSGGYGRAGITLERFPEEPSMDSARVVLGGDLRGS